jgi:NADPH:quinone reductase-like Zn-dependent oxidoreductase
MLGIATKFLTTFQILGEDVAGIVVQVGSSVSKVKKGDHVLGHCVSLATGELSQGGFQSYSVVPEILVSPIPDSLSFEQAAVIPLGLSTAAAGLYQKDCLKLPYPKPGSQKSTGTSILVWGGSGSVGGTAVQLAAASGVEVTATCSKRNFDYVKGLGATHVVDYNDPSAVNEIVKHLQGTQFAGAFDSISHEETYKVCGAVAERMGGGLVTGTLPAPKGVDLGKGVTTKDGRSFSIIVILNAFLD